MNLPADWKCLQCGLGPADLNEDSQPHVRPVLRNNLVVTCRICGKQQLVKLSGAE